MTRSKKQPASLSSNNKPVQQEHDGEGTMKAADEASTMMQQEEEEYDQLQVDGDGKFGQLA